MPVLRAEKPPTTRRKRNENKVIALSQAESAWKGNEEEKGGYENSLEGGIKGMQKGE